MHTTVPNVSAEILIEQSKAHPSELAKLLGNAWTASQLHEFIGSLLETRIAKENEAISHILTSCTKRLYGEARCSDNTINK